MLLKCGKKEKLSLEERRARYHCRRFVEAKNFPTWAESSSEVISENIETPFKIDEELNKKIVLYHGDITTIECDAIVNAANRGCLGGGGVDGSIHSAAGNQLYQECRTLHGCPTGQTKITRGYDLPAKYVLHSVGPIGESSEELQSCYLTCMNQVVKYNLKIVVFCGISTGIYGYPLFPASQIALKTIRIWLETDNNREKVDKIVFCTFLERERFCYNKLTPFYFPVPKSKGIDNNTIQNEKNDGYDNNIQGEKNSDNNNMESDSIDQQKQVE